MQIRIYYEDTDAGGVVYHANYLHYFERARTEYLRKQGLSVAQLARDGHTFPVVRLLTEFKSPARLDDLLLIETTPKRVGKASFTMIQKALRSSDGMLLVTAEITLACVNDNMKAHRIPKSVRTILEQGIVNAEKMQMLEGNV